MSNLPAPLRRRTRDLAKRLAVIDAGRELFAAAGAKAVTVEQVLTRTGVSRGTFYANFVSADSLLEAVVTRECDRLVEALFSEPPGAGELEPLLRRFGTGLLTFLSNPEMMAFERRLTNEVDTRPELARRFFQRRTRPAPEPAW